MEITVYKRHADDCEHRADRAYRRCTCRMMLAWFDNGKRFRISAKTRSWSEAEQRARAMMQEAHARTVNEQPKAAEPVSLERAVEMFITKKSGKHKETTRKYRYALDRLKAWAAHHGRHYLADITESDLEKYQASWTFKSNYAKRNTQERLRAFFRYCCASAEIKLAYNPTAQLEHFNVTGDEPEDPYTDKEYQSIVSAVDTCGFEPAVAGRVKALISVMRYAGLAIQDASILERSAVTPATVNGKGCYRVTIRRSKTHTGVSNVVPKGVPAAVRWISAEPLLEDISADVNLEGFGWVVVGGESGSGQEYLWNPAEDWKAENKKKDTDGRRTMRYLWAANLRDKVKAAGLSFMFKQVTAPIEY